MDAGPYNAPEATGETVGPYDVSEAEGETVGLHNAGEHRSLLWAQTFPPRYQSSFRRERTAGVAKWHERNE